MTILSASGVCGHVHIHLYNLFCWCTEKKTTKKSKNNISTIIKSRKSSKNAMAAS